MAICVALDVINPARSPRLRGNDRNYKTAYWFIDGQIWIVQMRSESCPNSVRIVLRSIDEQTRSCAGRRVGGERDCGKARGPTGMGDPSQRWQKSAATKRVSRRP